MNSSFIARILHAFRSKTQYLLRNDKMQSSKPIVVVLGATGTGKSKLAIDLCAHFDGEVINADSMQVYKGLSIVTNKVSKEEKNSVPHHLMDFLDPLISYTVVNYRNDSLPVIYSLLEKGKLPVIVGGTNYYIESLLWDVLINPENVTELVHERDEKLKNPNDFLLTVDNIRNIPLTKHSTQDLSTEYLYDLLKQIDMKSALEIHPNERRKILRRLQIFQQNGCTYSELVARQRSLDGGCNLGGPLRYKNVIMLWLRCEKDVLKKRLNERAEKMMQQGLIEELSDFHAKYNEKRLKEDKTADYSEGIFQSIGFKEFHPYLLLDEETRRSAKGVELLEKCLENMKTATKRYANYQNKWVRNRFLGAADRQTPNIYALDTSDLEKWQSNVVNLAIDIVKSHINKTSLPANCAPLQKTSKKSENDKKTYFCEVCERVFVGSDVWNFHQNSRRHAKIKKRKLREQKDKNEISAKT
ncbi:tRNA dimethylallyltransferase-like protein [Dinothrombium tinctorium]|uniref:tRNA dimethylallyltransferase-like protein n=1 Tax=Dinothrombium tinctorium TaxID=1965070 RepID=A0A443RCV8_9ACAR|nr:tRNA dimethylallyltransferase-like protein [Dinothrombium tinctorium]